MLKQVTIALSLLGLSCTAFAGMPGNPMPVPSGVVLNAPDSFGAWSFGIEALYVQPTGGNFQYAQVDNNTAPNTLSNKSVDSGYNWAGEADLTYRFAGSSRDVTLGYMHLDTDESDTTTVSGLQTFNQSLAFVPDTAKGETDYDYNAVDLSFGQQLLVGERVVLHPFIGLRYADIEQDNKVTYNNTASVVDTGVEKVNSDFQGVGPRAGIDARILTGCGLSFIGTMGGALLVGDTNSQVSSTPFGVFGTSTVKWTNDDAVNIVPELDGRLAIDYTPHAFFPEASVGFQLGYEVVHYFDALSNNAIDTVELNSVNINSDFSYQGPYFRLQLNFT